MSAQVGGSYDAAGGGTLMMLVGIGGRGIVVQDKERRAQSHNQSLEMNA